MDHSEFDHQNYSDDLDGILRQMEQLEQKKQLDDKLLKEIQLLKKQEAHLRKLLDEVKSGSRNTHGLLEKEVESGISSMRETIRKLNK